MIRHIACLATLFAVFSFESFAQSTWKTDDIPDSLRQGANSVVRCYTLHTVATSSTDYTVTYHKVLTILNRNGNSDGSWTCCSDKFAQLSSFSGVIYDANGKQVEKLKKSDLGISTLSEHLATDNVYNYYTPPVMSYPYTVEYTWQMKGNDGYIDFPVFWPVHVRQSLQSAEYTLTVPSDIDIVSRCSVGMCDANSSVNGKNTEYKWSLPAMRCVISDYYDDEPLHILPYVMSGPQSFTFAKTNGSMKNWEEFGKWYYSLSIGRDEVPAEISGKVKELTADCHTVMEKIKALYAYLAENTRYVSIQLGIGGWQPMSATEVAKTGFGDCKALTNYMQALLKLAGVQSYPLLVSTTDSKLMHDFPNMHQVNHVLLAVPQDNDAMLLVECTNPQLPLGFVPERIAGHDALMITSDGGRMIQIEDYTPLQNRECVNAAISIHTDGKADMHFTWNHFGCCYSDVTSLTSVDKDKCKDIIRRWMPLKDATIHTVGIDEEKKGVDSHLLFDCNAGARFGDAGGERFFVPCNPFRNYKPVVIRGDRTRPIIVDFPHSRCDSISITIPEDMTVEAIPNDEYFENRFGNCSLTVRQEGDSISVIMSATFEKGNFAIEHRNEFEMFQKRVSDITGRQIVLVRKQPQKTNPIE